jgi:hypothetical protein
MTEASGLGVQKLGLKLDVNPCTKAAEAGRGLMAKLAVAKRSRALPCHRAKARAGKRAIRRAEEVITSKTSL